MIIPRQPIINPAIPLVEKFSNPLHPGTTIMIIASTPPSANRFTINLALGDHFEDKPGRSPIAFHFNPRFRGSYVTVRNTFHEKKFVSLLQKRWGREETASPNGIFPFQEGQHFEIMITVSPDDYVVAVNGQHYINYRHRISYQKVTTLQVLEEINVKRMMVVEGPYSLPIPTTRPESTEDDSFELVN